MNYVQSPHFEHTPSARARIAALRKARADDLANVMAMAMPLSATAEVTRHLEDQILMCDLADILLDAMKHGPDNPIVRDIPGRSQMQEQGPAEGVPHTGLPADLHNTFDGKPAYPAVTKDVLFAVGNSVVIGPVPASHVHLCLTGRIATLLEIEEWQEWMKEPWYRMRCTGEDGYGKSEGSLPQSALRLQFG